MNCQSTSQATNNDLAMRVRERETDEAPIAGPGRADDDIIGRLSAT